MGYPGSALDRACGHAFDKVFLNCGEKNHMGMVVAVPSAISTPQLISVELM